MSCWYLEVSVHLELHVAEEQYDPDISVAVYRQLALICQYHQYLIETKKGIKSFGLFYIIVNNIIRTI
jgi:hypothetical protein